MLLQLYRKLIPLYFRQKMYDWLVGDVVFFFRHFSVILNAKARHWFRFAFPASDRNMALAFIGKHGITSYPYPYMLEYRNRAVEVLVDLERQLPYVMHNGHKLFFPKGHTTPRIEKDYRALITEQDPRSAHRYVKSYDELKGKTLLDVGAAEGIFSLDTIELTHHTILFECVDYWQPALEATFAPWRNKVTIVKKFVGDKTHNNYISLDDFLGNDPNNLFLKMDIEGAERLALAGASRLLKESKNMQLAICTYHRPGDPEFMDHLLRQNGFATEFTDGLMYWNKRLSKGLIRAKRA